MVQVRQQSEREDFHLFLPPYTEAVCLKFSRFKESMKKNNRKILFMKSNLYRKLSAIKVCPGLDSTQGMPRLILETQQSFSERL